MNQIILMSTTYVKVMKLSKVNEAKYSKYKII